MGIPNKISPLTGGDILPRGYIAAEFLESDGKTAVIDSQIIPDFETGVYVKMRVFDITSGEYYFLGTQNGYSQPPFWIRCVTANLQVEYYSRAATISLNSLADKAFEVEINWMNSKLAKAENLVGTLTQAEEAPWKFHLTFFRATFKGNTCFDNGSQARFYYIKMSQGVDIVRDMVPCISPTGEPCMYDKATKQPFKNAATGAFIVGMTVSQARYLCKLPVVESGTLTVSLPWEAQWDTGVQNALSIAAAKGWTITVQYRDPEVATANMPISFVESNADSLIWFTAPTPATSAEIELDIQHTQTRASQQATCGIAGHTGNWVRVEANETMYSLNSSLTGTNALERSVLLFKWKAIPDDPDYAGRSSLSVQGITKESIARNTTEATGAAVLNYDKGSWNPYYAYARVWRVRAKVGDWEVKGTPRLTTKGVPVMYDVDSKIEYPPTKGNNFIAGFDTAIQARNLAYLPDVTAETDTAKKSLTVSLPWEAQLVITGVPAALQVATDRGWTITVQYRDPEADNAYYNKYATCVTVADMFAVNSQYVADLTANDEWIYPLSSFKSGKCIFGWAYADYPNGRPTPIKVFNADMPVATHIDGMFMRCSDLELLKGIFPKVTHATELCWGCQKLSVVEAEFPALYLAGSMFSQCQLNKESILRVLNSIPSYTSGTHPLTIGIHTDLQTDEEVTTAIANAEAKGWTLTVQWNGTATAAAASTFGLRTPSIYAKLVTMERPDDTTEQILDWGHYVTNWEENGYQEFSSVEEAEEYFNINQTEEV